MSADTIWPEPGHDPITLDIIEWATAQAVRGRRAGHPPGRWPLPARGAARPGAYA
jgi:hypothetical protein